MKNFVGLLLWVFWIGCSLFFAVIIFFSFMKSLTFMQGINSCSLLEGKVTFSIQYLLNLKHIQSENPQKSDAQAWQTFILHDPFSLFCQVYIQNKPLLPIFLCRTDVNDATHRADAIQRQLRDLQGSRNNKLKLFGSWVPDLLQRVEQAERRGKFHQKPVGPIGNTLFFFLYFFFQYIFFIISQKDSNLCLN